jgi:hypothetical protein
MDEKGGLRLTLARSGGSLHLSDGLVDLGPHVLQTFGGAAGHVNLSPGDSLVAITLELRNDMEEKLALYHR